MIVLTVSPEDVFGLADEDVLVSHNALDRQLAAGRDLRDLEVGRVGQLLLL